MLCWPWGVINKWVVTIKGALLFSVFHGVITTTLTPMPKCIELNFWQKSLVDFNFQPIWHTASAARFQMPATQVMLGMWSNIDPSSLRQWSAMEAAQTSTWCELCGMRLVLESVACKLANSRVRWITVNQNVACILTVSCRKSQLQEEVFKAFGLAMKFNVRLDPEWIPRELNEQADYLSSICNLDDYLLNPLIFAELDALWGATLGMEEILCTE